MVVIKTTLKKIPDKCSKCKFRSKGSSSQTLYCGISSHKEIQLTYSEELNSYGFFRPKWCPLFEIEDMR